jgi:hypothetical protein
MDKGLYFELMVELSHKDTWVNYDLLQVDIISDPSCRCVAAEP